MTALFDRLILTLGQAMGTATVIIALAAAVAALSRRSSASFRHLVWALGLGGALLLPLFSLALPNWRVAVRVPVVRSKPRVTPSPVASPAFQPIQEPVASVPSSAIQPPPTATTVPIAPHPTAQNRMSSAHARFSSSANILWTTWVLLVWAAGVLSVAARMVRSLLSLRATAKRSHPVTDGPLADAMTSARVSVGVTRPVTLFSVCAEAMLSVPITWGTLRPRVALPAQATEWPQDRLRSALLHELAHVRRGDWPAQVMANVACALHWFNPLVWMAARKMRTESETACDDLVLAAGVPAADYARHLLDVALLARGGRQIGAGTVAMVQTPRIEGRLRTVLATGLKRGSVGGRLAWGAVAVALLLGLPLAALRLVPPAEAQHAMPSERPTIASATTQTVEGGGLVRLVGVSYFPSDHQPWWGADGSRLAHPPIVASDNGSVHFGDQADAQVREFFFETHGTGDNLGATVVEPAMQYVSPSAHSPGSLNVQYTPPSAHSAGALDVKAVLAASARTCTLRVGVSSRSWRTIASYTHFSDHQNQEALSRGDEDSWKYTLNFSPPDILGGKVAFTVTDTDQVEPSRLVAVDRSGRIAVGKKVEGGTSARGVHQQTVVFPTLRLGDIRALAFQVRPWQWLEFRDIPLQPLPSPPSFSAALPVPHTADTAAVHVARGLKLRNGQPCDGISEFRRAVQIDPNDAEAQESLAWALYEIRFKHFVNRSKGERGDVSVMIPPSPAVLDEAILHMKRAVALRPNDARWQSTLGIYLENRGRYAEAIPCYRWSLHLLGPAPGMGPSHQGALLSDKQRARYVFESQSSLGRVFVETGRYQEALAQYQKAIKFHLKDDEVLLGYGDALYGVGRRTEARAVWRKLLAIQPANPYYQQQARKKLAQQQGSFLGNQKTRSRDAPLSSRRATRTAAVQVTRGDA